MHIRTVHQVFTAKGTYEGAGVKLHRGFGYFELPKFDPFLLFDDFSSPQPADYLPGFPWHPHRGIETVTYVLDGAVAHEDSIGNAGTISNGAVQWMTAGSGIIHKEMPQGYTGIQGFQLWVNLPKEAKMTRPQYQEFQSGALPDVALGEHATVKVIAGTANEQSGPISDITAQPLFVDISLQANKAIHFPVVHGHTVFIYIFEGAVATSPTEGVKHQRGNVVLFERDGDRIYVKAGGSGARFLLVAGKPINEPIAWHGPIVMNTAEELDLAFAQLDQGNFIQP